VPLFFGAYSFTDKISNGIALFVIMNSGNVSDCSCSDYLRYMICIIPGTACFVAWILVMIGKAADYGQGQADAVYDPFESFAKPKKVGSENSQGGVH